MLGNYHGDFELGPFEQKNSIKEGNLETGELLVTGFHNYAMPFIRYEVGDMLTFNNDSCKCGLQSQIIQGVNGHSEEYVITTEGTRIMRFDYLFKGTHDILEAQVIQRELGEIVIRSVPRNSYCRVIIERGLVEKVRTVISPTIRVCFEYVY